MSASWWSKVAQRIKPLTRARPSPPLLKRQKATGRQVPPAKAKDLKGTVLTMATAVTTPQIAVILPSSSQVKEGPWPMKNACVIDACLPITPLRSARANGHAPFAKRVTTLYFTQTRTLREQRSLRALTPTRKAGSKGIRKGRLSVRSTAMGT